MVNIEVHRRSIISGQPTYIAQINSGKPFVLSVHWNEPVPVPCQIVVFVKHRFSDRRHYLENKLLWFTTSFRKRTDASDEKIKANTSKSESSPNGHVFVEL